LGDKISYPASPETPVIEFNRIIHSLADTASKPRLRIFGDGTVAVHFPPYMKRAGDYTLTLSSEALDDLLLTLGRLGVFHFDAEAMRAKKHQRIMRKNRQVASKDSKQPLRVILDADTTELHVNIDSFLPAAAGLSALGKVNNRIRWQGLKSDVTEFPELHELRELLEAEDLLEQLTFHPGLKKTTR
jgi:hypothetical protein